MSEIIYKRDCPGCGKETTYKSKDSLLRAIRENRLCFECACKKRRLPKIIYKRDCPGCGKEIAYKQKI